MRGLIARLCKEQEQYSVSQNWDLHTIKGEGEARRKKEGKKNNARKNPGVT